MKKICIISCIFLLSIFSLTACGKKDSKDTKYKVENGPVSSPEDLKQVGVYLDVNSSKIKSKSYEIQNDAVAVVAFDYDGMACEFRASSAYSEYVLAGVKNTSDGSMISTSVDGYGAAIYTLAPGRIVFWQDDNINYSLYISVTAMDDIVYEVISALTFENHYYERPDVIAKMDEESKAFAEKVVDIVKKKDKAVFGELLSYPMMLENGHPVSNTSEYEALNSEDIFTENLVNAIDDKALEELRKTEDGQEYILGTKYVNIHFKMENDGTFKIVKINN